MCIECNVIVVLIVVIVVCFVLCGDGSYYVLLDVVVEMMC